MQFLYPAFLWTLLALALPIILHLFYFRRFKKVYFTNVKFLREVKEDTSARSRLRNLLVLLLRLLAIAFLVLAFAQPFFPTKGAEKAGIKAVSIYLDNSFSMNALSKDVGLLEKAKQRARAIVEAYAVDDKFQILTNDFSGRQQVLVNREDALGLIDEVVVGPAVQPLSRVVARQKQALALSKTDNQVAYLISDFQRSITDLGNYLDTLPQFNLVPLQAVQERNLAVDSVWFEAPVQMVNQTNRLLVRVKNYGEERQENVRLSLEYEGQTKPLGVVSLPPNGTVVDTANITVLRTGWHEANLTVTDYPIQFDDVYHCVFFVAPEIGVLTINEGSPNAYLEAAIRGIPYFKGVAANSQGLDYAAFSRYRLIVLNDLSAISSGLRDELRAYVEQGGNLLVFPAKNADLSNYRSFAQTFQANEIQAFEVQERIVGEVNTAEFVFNDVFENRSSNLRLPATKGNFRLGRSNARQEEYLLSYRDGSSYLSKYRLGLGHLYFVAAPLSQEFNNLVNNGEIFIPMLYKMALSAGTGGKLAYTLGREELLESEYRNNGAALVFKMKGQGEEFIPEQRIVGNKVFLNPHRQLKQAGVYDLFVRPDTIQHRFAFNYNRRESQLTYYRPAELSALVGPKVNVIQAQDQALLTVQIAEKTQGIVLWRWCILLTLLFLAMEVLVLRFWRT